MKSCNFFKTLVLFFGRKPGWQMGWEPMKSLEREDEEQFEDNHLGGFAAPTRRHNKNPEVFHKKTRSLATSSLFFFPPKTKSLVFQGPQLPNL